MAQAAVAAQGDGVSAVRLESLKFGYPGCAASIKGVNLDLPRGSRCLLIGANGAGGL
jgi:CCR4-NOT complex subunit CAF16